MGLRKLFKAKELTDKDVDSILETNGVVTRDKGQYHRSKFKFGEFGKFSEQQGKNKDKTLRPIVPAGTVGYGYDGDNQGEGNQGLGYDAHANEYQTSSRSEIRGRNYDGYNGYDSGSYGGTSYGGAPQPTYGYQPDQDRQGYSGSAAAVGGSSSRYGNSSRDNRIKPAVDRRPQMRQNATYAGVGAVAGAAAVAASSVSAGSYSRGGYDPSVKDGTNKYGYEPSVKDGTNKYGYEPSIRDVAPSIQDGTNKYGYEPSIRDAASSIQDGTAKYGYEPSLRQEATSHKANDPSVNDAYDASNGYGGYDPYSLTSSKPQLKKDATTKSESAYDPYSDKYAGYGKADSDDVYGFNVEESYNDNDTIHGNESKSVTGVSNGMQALQLESEHQQQEGQTQKQYNDQDQDQEFDPYGPAVSGMQEQSQDQYQGTGDLDLNAYEPTPILDNDEFEEVDEDEEELNRIQRQTKDVREDTVRLTRQLVDNLSNANVTATNTLGVLGSQREKIYEMENSTSTMDVQTRFVDEHVKQLEHYNRSLFHIKVNNPFTRSARKQARDRAFLAQRQEDRENKDKLNNSLYESQKAIMDQLKNDGVKSDLQEKYNYERRVREAEKYLTADHDEEDERNEVEIATNIDTAQKFANNLKKKAELMSREIDKQNRDLQTIGQNVDKIDDKLVMSTRRIRGI